MTRLEPTIVAVFDDRLEAERAVSDLEAVHFDENKIGYVIRGSDVMRGGMISDFPGADFRRGSAEPLAWADIASCT